jgi:chromosomal replication initiation ATPase DnaA
MNQLILNLNTPTRHGFDELVIHKGNRCALEAIRGELAKPGSSMKPALVIGDSGSGKTHLLKASMELMNRSIGKDGARGVHISCRKGNSEGLSVNEALRLEDNLIDNAAGFFLDDIEELAEGEDQDLWTLFNKAMRGFAALIMSSRGPVGERFLDNAHLVTRIESAIQLRLDAPDDNARLLIVDKLIRDRNIRVSHEVCRYMVNHFSGNMKQMEELIMDLDLHSMRMKRRITIPFIKAFMEI